MLVGLAAPVALVAPQSPVAAVELTAFFAWAAFNIRIMARHGWSDVAMSVCTISILLGPILAVLLLGYLLRMLLH